MSHNNTFSWKRNYFCFKAYENWKKKPKTPLLVFSSAHKQTAWWGWDYFWKTNTFCDCKLSVISQIIKRQQRAKMKIRTIKALAAKKKKKWWHIRFLNNYKKTLRSFVDIMRSNDRSPTCPPPQTSSSVQLKEWGFFSSFPIV